jgi:triacylglycerol lipase
MPISNKRLPAIVFLLLLFASLVTSVKAQSPSEPIDFSAIRHYATLAKAAYATEDRFSDIVDTNQYTLKYYRNIPEVEVSYLIASDKQSGAQLIAVRGTSNVENALVDIALKLRDDPLAGIKIHEGFSHAASRIYSDLKPDLDPSKAVNTTGHSLGGAVALILAMYLERDGFTIGDVITFGQPKVTNIAGSRKYAQLNLTRVVTPRDLVPLVPPLDPLDIQNMDIYWHGGKEVLLNTDNTYSILEGSTSMLRATKFTQQMLDEQNLHNHKMDLYLSLIDSMLQQSTQVTFKNDFNLFNLFGQ